jgi:hypothetical protein
MTSSNRAQRAGHWALMFVSAALLGLAGCASRPVNPPITQVDPNGGYTVMSSFRL